MPRTCGTKMDAALQVIDNTAIEISDKSKYIIDGHGQDLFVAIGCSWTRAWGATDDCMDPSDPNYQDDLDFFNNHSFVAHLANHLGYPAKIVLAQPGASNDMQTRLLVELLQKNRAQFNRIFVLWGITSHLRWELYSNQINAPSKFTVGSSVPPGKEQERKWFLTRHWNDTYELERLSQKIVTISAYLQTLDIDHLLFPAFESYNTNNMNLAHVQPKYFFNIDRPVNDMLHLWCQEENIQVDPTVLSNPYSKDDRAKLSELVKLGYLSKAHAHPTAKGHRDIATRLINYINQTRNLL